MRALERFREAGFVVHVRRHHLGPERGQLACLRGARIACQRPHGKAAARVVQNRADQSAALRPVAPTTAMTLSAIELSLVLSSAPSLNRTLLPAIRKDTLRDCAGGAVRVDVRRWRCLPCHG